MSSLTIRSLWMPKAGHDAHDYEDAFAFDEARGLLALADGASSAYQAGAWARRLVGELTAGSRWVESRSTCVALLETTARGWVEEIGRDPDLTLPVDRGGWWREEAERRGSYATVIGLFVDLSTPGRGSCRWGAVAVGDSCLFQLRDGRLVVPFPLTSAEQFSNRPPLVCSVTGQVLVDPAADVRSIGGEARPGDVFVLASDALAKWALEAARSDGTVWTVLATLRSGEFTRLVEHLRSTGEIENDDTTLLRAVVR